jgi:FkbM family methyltransferase
MILPKTVNTYLKAIVHPYLALTRLTRGLDFTELILMNDLKKQGLLDGVTTVVDAGAHYGGFSQIAHFILPHATIVAFEPVPETYDQLLASIKKRQSIVAHNVALGSETGESTMFINTFDQASSLLAPDNVQEKMWPKHHYLSRISVPVRTLDNFDLHNGSSGKFFIKADIQGSELELLKGASNTLLNTKLLRLEVSFAKLFDNGPLFGEVVTFLEQRQFRFHSIARTIKIESASIPVQADVIFVNENVLE